MEKIVLKASYRTDDEIYSTGYIILDDNSIEGVFTCDYAYIKIENKIIHLFLTMYSPLDSEYFNPIEFVSTKIESDTLECPCKYVLKAKKIKDLKIELSLIYKVTDKKIIAMAIDSLKKYKALALEDD